MNTFGLAILIFLSILFIFALLDRVCRCIEHCKDAECLSKAYSETEGKKEDK